MNTKTVSLTSKQRYFPDAVTIIFGLALIVVILSIIAESLGVSAVRPGSGELVYAKSLLSAENLTRLFAEMPHTYASFTPLGMVLVVMIGAGFAEKVGLFDAVLAKALRKVHRSALVPVTVLIGICAHITVDASYFVFIPLAGLAFKAAGRSAFVGICVSFAGVSGGYGANVLITPTDAVLYGITEAAARVIDDSISIDLVANYYLLFAYSVLVIMVVTFITHRFVEPYFDPKDDIEVENEFAVDDTVQVKGIKAAGVASVIFIFISLLLVVPDNAVLRDSEGTIAPFYEALIALICLFFLTTGIVFGIATKRITSDIHVMEMLRDAMKDVAPFLVLVFAAAHFGAFLQWSNLAVIASAQGADVLNQVGLTGMPLILGFTTMGALLNLLMASASGKWALMAPAVVPMLMAAGLSPEMITAAYRIGDSATNIITPTSLLPVVLIYAQRYRPDVGLGQFIKIMLPYSVALFIAGILLLIFWMTLSLPLGPSGASPYYSL